MRSYETTGHPSAMSSAIGKGDASGSGSKRGKAEEVSKVKAEPSTRSEVTPYVHTADPIRGYCRLDFEEDSFLLLFVTVEKVKREVSANTVTNLFFVDSQLASNLLYFHRRF